MRFVQSIVFTGLWAKTLRASHAYGFGLGGKFVWSWCQTESNHRRADNDDANDDGNDDDVSLELVPVNWVSDFLFSDWWLSLVTITLIRIRLLWAMAYDVNWCILRTIKKICISNYEYLRNHDVLWCEHENLLTWPHPPSDPDNGMTMIAMRFCECKPSSVHWNAEFMFFCVCCMVRIQQMNAAHKSITVRIEQSRAVRRCRRLLRRFCGVRYRNREDIASITKSSSRACTLHEWVAAICRNAYLTWEFSRFLPRMKSFVI